MRTETVDVLIIGSGNAGLSAASSAAASSPTPLRILVLDKAPRPWAGGNTTFTAGAYRTVFHGLADVLPLVRNVDAATAATIDMEPYAAADFHADLARVTGGRADPALAAALVGESRETTRWLAAEVGVPFVLSFHRQAYQVAGRTKFWGGMVLAVEDGGKGLTRAHLASCARRGVEVRFGHAAVDLVVEGGCPGGAVLGALVRGADGGEAYEVRARGGVVLAAGGFEASPERRAARLGAGWDAAHVRGTPYNTGELLDVAVRAAGAATAGHWGGCHSTCWDAGAPRHEGDRELTNAFTKSGYPLGLMVNARGERFVDEGQDMRNFTYARFGREVLRQPGGVAWQLWDARGAAWLRREEYAPEVVRRVEARDLASLAALLARDGLEDPAAMLATVADFNAAAARAAAAAPAGTAFDPSRKDGVSTRDASGAGVARGPDKTNWALPLTEPPFLAVKIACGITFTFGGLAADPETAGVVSAITREAIPGLYVAGEMLGGLFWDNYPGGSGLTAGAVFGRKAGREAARRAVEMRTKL